MAARIPWDGRNLIGTTFGKITITGTAGLDAHSAKMVEGTCACGSVKLYRYNNLKRGVSQSCGCDRKASVTTHNMRKNLAYSVWSSARSRHARELVPMQEDWYSDFNTFLAALGERPSIKHTLRLNDISKGYVAGNCAWCIRDKKIVEVILQSDDDARDGCQRPGPAQLLDVSQNSQFVEKSDNDLDLPIANISVENFDQ